MQAQIDTHSFQSSQRTLLQIVQVGKEDTVLLPFSWTLILGSSSGENHLFKYRLISLISSFKVTEYITFLIQKKGHSFVHHWKGRGFLKERWKCLKECNNFIIRLRAMSSNHCAENTAWTLSAQGTKWVYFESGVCCLTLYILFAVACPPQMCFNSEFSSTI